MLDCNIVGWVVAIALLIGFILGVLAMASGAAAVIDQQVAERCSVASASVAPSGVGK